MAFDFTWEFLWRDWCRCADNGGTDMKRMKQMKRKVTSTDELTIERMETDRTEKAQEVGGFRLIRSI